ncbi:MAG: hypothetical protein IKU07_07220 [Oscillospiraceae bacterium]|nr:hypothetical protein [Oscillospiraceae bacterium]
MIVFILMVIKIVATVFAIQDSCLLALSTTTLPLMFAWFFGDVISFNSLVLAVLYLVFMGVNLLSWLISPWFAISGRRTTAIVGFSFAIGLNVCDIVISLLSTLSVLDKVCNMSFSALIIGLSIWMIYKK